MKLKEEHGFISSAIIKQITGKYSMGLPNLLLLTHQPPNTSDVGGLWLRDICALYPPKALCLVSRQLGTEALQGNDNFPFTYIPCVFPRTHSRWFVRPFTTVQDRVVTYPALMKRLTEIGRDHQTGVVLAVLHQRTVIEIAASVAQRLNVPLVSVVWDPPEYVHFENDRLIEKFYEAVNRSQSCIVVSEAMAEQYSKTSSARMVVMQRGIPQAYWKSSTKAQNGASQPFVIGFAGSIYASREFECLIEALESIGWEIAGRRVQVSILSHLDEKVSTASSNIKYLGWHPTAEAIEELSNSDVLYLPYAFNERFRPAAYYSFPTKLSTYLAAGVPVFYHGPYESSVRRFMDKYPVGVGCYSNQHSDILEGLRSLLLDTDLRSNAVRSIMEVRTGMIDPGVFKLKFAEALQIDVAYLA